MSALLAILLLLGGGAAAIHATGALDDVFGGSGTTTKTEPKTTPKTTTREPAPAPAPAPVTTATEPEPTTEPTVTTGPGPVPTTPADPGSGPDPVSPGDKIDKDLKKSAMQTAQSMLKDAEKVIPVSPQTAASMLEVAIGTLEAAGLQDDPLYQRARALREQAKAKAGN